MERAPHLIDESQAAELLGFSQQWLSELRARGEGPPYYKLGKRIRYGRSDVLDWLDKHKHYPKQKEIDL